MRYANIIKNDAVNGHGICVSLFTQGCTRHCLECFNPETWDLNGGQEIDREELILKLKYYIGKNGILRNFSILGGEPLLPENRADVIYIIKSLREWYPEIEVWIWTGYTLDELKEISKSDKDINWLLHMENGTLIDGPYIAKERDLSLPHRGSRNQNIYSLPID